MNEQSAPEQLYRAESITHDPAWVMLHGAMRAAVSVYVARRRPLPGVFDPRRRDPVELRSRYLLTVATERAASDQLDRLAVSAGQWAIHYGATPEQLAAVDGTTPEQAAARYAIPEDFRDEDFLPQRPEWKREGSEPRSTPTRSVLTSPVREASNEDQRISSR